MQKVTSFVFKKKKSIIDIEREVTSTEELKKEYFELLSSNSIHYVEWKHKSSNPCIEFSEFPDFSHLTEIFQRISAQAQTHRQTRDLRQKTRQYVKFRSIRVRAQTNSQISCNAQPKLPRWAFSWTSPFWRQVLGCYQLALLCSRITLIAST